MTERCPLCGLRLIPGIAHVCPPTAGQRAALSPPPEQLSMTEENDDD